jgi:DNA replication protein DnaC
MASEAAPQPIAGAMGQFAKYLSDPSPEQVAAVDRRREAAESREAERKRQDRASAWDAVVREVGRRHASATLDSYVTQCDEQSRAKGMVESYAKNVVQRVRSGTNLVLYGPPGTGKDHLAVAVLRAAVGAGMRPRAIDGQVLFQRARDAISSDLGERELLTPYLHADLLLLSDPIPPLESTGGPREYQLSLLWRIVDGRYREMRPTVVTLNVATREEMDRRLAPNLVDRLIDGAFVVCCKWPSHRAASEK